MLIKDLYVENAQLLKALEVSEQRQKVAEKKNYLLEEKISSLNKIVRELSPSPLMPVPYHMNRSWKPSWFVNCVSALFICFHFLLKRALRVHINPPFLHDINIDDREEESFVGVFSLVSWAKKYFDAYSLYACWRQKKCFIMLLERGDFFVLPWRWFLEQLLWKHWPTLSAETSPLWVGFEKNMHSWATQFSLGMEHIYFGQKTVFNTEPPT